MIEITIKGKGLDECLTTDNFALIALRPDRVSDKYMVTTGDAVDNSALYFGLQEISRYVFNVILNKSEEEK